MSYDRIESFIRIISASICSLDIDFTITTDVVSSIEFCSSTSTFADTNNNESVMDSVWSVSILSSENIVSVTGFVSKLISSWLDTSERIVLDKLSDSWVLVRTGIETSILSASNNWGGTRISDFNQINRKILFYYL